jgi:peroxiredoxin
MKKILSITLAIIAAVSPCIDSAKAQSAALGSKAPSFELTNAEGKTIRSQELAGKTVVLEWFNPDCPFVKKFYSRGDMPRFQEQARQLGAVWLTINSSAAGRQGHISLEAARAVAAEHKINPADLLLDPDGKVGRAFSARVTPHIFVIDPQGNLVYAGAIDSAPSTSTDDIAGATNYAMNTLASIKRGEAIKPFSTEPYGCSVKY